MVDQTKDPHLPSLPESKLPELEVSRPDREGRVTIRLSLGGIPKFVDTCKPESDRSRTALANKAAAMFPVFNEPEARERLTSAIMAKVQVFDAEVVGGQQLPERPSAEQLIDYLEAQEIELFHRATDGEPEGFLSRVVDERRETFRIGSRSCRHVLARIAWDAFHSVLHEQTLNEVRATIEMMACTGGVQYPVGIRSLSYEGKVFVDLANETWSVVEISASGYVVQSSMDVPVRFVRPAGIRPLPTPSGGGTLDDLADLLNLPGNDELLLLEAWMVAAFRTGLPYAALVVTGEAGSAKSSFCETVRSLTDPNACNLRALPKNRDDLFSAAMNSRLQSYENLSGLTQEMSNAMCIILTGGSNAKRKLYSDNEEAFAVAHNPMLLNGIENPATRSDLADRSVVFSLPPIAEEDRELTEDYYRKLDEMRPRILGALFELVARTLKELPGVRVARLPRMADFCRCGIAVERALGLPDGAFLAAYKRNYSTSHLDAILASPIGPPLLELLRVQRHWEGSATELLGELKALLPDDGPSANRLFPKSASALSRSLRRLRPSLRVHGICSSDERDSGHGRERRLALWVPDGGGSGTSSDASDVSDGIPTAFSGRKTPPPLRPAQHARESEAVERAGKRHDSHQKGGCTEPPKLGEMPSDASEPSDIAGLPYFSERKRCPGCGGVSFHKLHGAPQRICSSCHPPSPTDEVEARFGGNDEEVA